MTAVLLLAALAALLILTLATRNPVVQFVLFFVLGSLVLALWKVLAEIPWWGWLLFLVTTAVSFVVWRVAYARGSRHD